MEALNPRDERRKTTSTDHGQIKLSKYFYSTTQAVISCGMIQDSSFGHGENKYFYVSEIKGLQIWALVGK